MDCADENHTSIVLENLRISKIQVKRTSLTSNRTTFLRHGKGSALGHQRTSLVTKTTSLRHERATIYINIKVRRERAGCTGTEANKFSAGPLSHTTHSSSLASAGRQSAEWKALIQKCGPAGQESQRASAFSGVGPSVRPRTAQWDAKARIGLPKWQSASGRVNFKRLATGACLFLALSARTAKHRSICTYGWIYIMQLRPAAL